MPIKNVFLDLDDTILDFHAAERQGIREAFLRFGIDPTDELLTRYSEINRSLWEALERGEYTRETILSLRFAKLFAERFPEGNTPDPCEMQAVYEDRLSRVHSFIFGAPELLETLYPKYDLYLATNGTVPVQERRIRESGIGKYFKGVFVSALIGADKPTKAYFDLCFAKIPGFRREESVIVGDSLTSDILGGKNAGIQTVWFNPKGRQNTTRILPDHEIAALSELPALLENM